MTNRSELLAEALNKTQRSGAKISRIRNKNGAEVAGTEFDPRVSRERIKHYNSKQLESYIKKQDRFLRRQVQFVPMLHGAPLPANEWKQYQRAENEINARRKERLAQVEDIVLPNQPHLKWKADKTIGDLVKEKGASKLAYYDSSDSMTKDTKMESVTFTSRESVAKMRDFLKEQKTTRWEAAASARGDYAISAMLGYIGSEKLNKKFQGLTVDQLDTLWNYTDFASHLGIWYEEMKLKNTGKDYNEDILTGQGPEVEQWLDWAGKL